MAAFHNRLLLAAGRQPSPCKTNSAHVRGFTKGDLLSFLETGAPGVYRLLDFDGANFYPFPPMIAKPLARLFPHPGLGYFLPARKTKKLPERFYRLSPDSKAGNKFLPRSREKEVMSRGSGAGAR